MLAPEKSHEYPHRRVAPRWDFMIGQWIYGLAQSLQRRWRLYRMQSLDDHLLDDIGITREELEWAIRLPLHINAALALQDRAKRRRMTPMPSSTCDEGYA